MIKQFLRKLFKIHSPSKELVGFYDEYHERDTRCDLCDRKSECELMDVTHSKDTRTHVLNAFGYICPKEAIVSKAAKELYPIVNECPCNKCSYEVKMSCKRCDEYYDWINKLKGEQNE